MAKRKASSNVRKAGAGADEVPALRVHIVRRGDTLGALARYYLGSSSRADSQLTASGRMTNSPSLTDDKEGHKISDERTEIEMTEEELGKKALEELLHNTGEDE